MYIFLVDCTVFKRSKKPKIHRPRQATQLRSWAGIGKVGILELEFFLAFEEEKNFTPGPSARVGIFNFGKDRVRVGYRVYLQKKILIGYFRVLEILIGYILM